MKGKVERMAKGIDHRDDPAKHGVNCGGNQKTLLFDFRIIFASFRWKWLNDIS